MKAGSGEGDQDGASKVDRVQTVTVTKTEGASRMGAERFQ